MPLAVSSLRDLDQVHELFTNMGEKARAGKVLVSFRSLVRLLHDSYSCTKPVLTKLQERAHASVEEYQSQSKISPVSAKRESSQELVIKQEDELATLAGKTRLVSKKAQSPSSRGSRSPVSSPAVTFNSQSPSTSPISPTSPATYPQGPLFGGPHLQTQPNFYTQQHQQQPFVSPIEPSPPNPYRHSPETVLFPMGISPDQIHQSQSHSQPPAQQAPLPPRGFQPGHRPSHSHSGPAAPRQEVEWTDHAMSYDPPGGMAHVPVYDEPRSQQPQQSMSEPNFSNMISFNDPNMMGSMGQYGLSGYYGMGGPDSGGMYQGYMQQGYAPNADMMSPSDLQMDLNGAWTNLMNEAQQYGMTR